MGRRATKQIEIDFRPHGGRRPGAGRKPVGDKAGVPHRRRAKPDGRAPSLVTMKVQRSVWNLRTRRAFVRIFEALLSKVQEPGGDSPFAEITDEDIDNLFND
jgi:hypothetical protein